MSTDKFEKPDCEFRLERLFHEPNRLAVMSALCSAEGVLSFVELRDRCGLTDGNLSRHLKTLEEGGAVTIEKRFVDLKPRTTIHLSDDGLRRFGAYLETLEGVLRQARSALGVDAPDKTAEAPTAYPVWAGGAA